MGLCDKRHFLLTICVLQIITTTERQVFDFLGYMWVPILLNFFNIIFVILGFFGAFQYRPKYIITYCVWNVAWLSWNAFLICFYLDVGGLDKNSDLLNLGTGSFSWWLINGPGCKEYSNNTMADQPDAYRPIRPESVTGCLLDYEVIEVLHSSIQCVLTVLSVIGGICLSRVFLEEDDSSQIRKKKLKKKHRLPLYSIEYSRPEPVGVPHPQQQQLHHQHHQQHQQDDENNVSPKPMTPRRVKRRSVISRDGTHRRSGQRLRSSTASRQSARRKNPVNRIMDQQESLYANAPACGPTGVPLPGLAGQASLSHGTLNYDRISGHWDRDRTPSHPNLPSWQLEALSLSASSPSIWAHEAVATYSTGPGPVIHSAWDTSSSTRQLAESWQSAAAGGGGVLPSPAGELPAPPGNPMQWQGQSNPSFQQTSTQSLNGEDLEELYGNRPASARSSYSNYHGVRATPQVPSRSDVVRQSQRQFVLSGPPAYQDTVI